MPLHKSFKHWGRQYFRHGLETHPTQTASIGNLSVNSQVLVGGVGSY